jgi:hypothetical protein
MRDMSGIGYWVLEQDKHEAYKGVSQEVLRDELAHKEFIAEQQKLAQGYKSQITVK